MKKLFYFLSLTMMLVSCQQTKESVQPNFSTYDSYLSNEVKEGRLVGVQGMVFQDGKLIYEKSYGLRDRESGDSMKGNELYFIQSMTKPIVSAALMTLYDEGKFQLDDPVSKYLPEFSSLQVVKDPTQGSSTGTYPAVSPVTIRQALSHTAGMSHGIAPIAYDKEIWNALILNPNIKTLGERVTALSKLPLMWEPGSKWNYSFTPDIVGRLVEVISGKDLSAYLQEKIFDPLGMKETGYNLSEDQQKRVMVVYGFNPDSSLRRMDPQPSMSRNTIYSGVNALFSSAKDYLTFATMLLNRGELNGKRILKPETVDLMSSDHTGGIRYRLDTSSQYVRLGNGIVTDSLGTLNLEPGYQFGLGLAIVQDPAKAKRTAATKGEFFWSGANSTYFFVNPSKKLVGIFMTQVASVGNPNPYGFYFGDQMRASIYKGVE
ncbi:MAG: serine hydrolase domain-containing protein [Bacteroidota bacterium]|jgi:CubicO group peptidase (beta-lactamase class C family)